MFDWPEDALIVVQYKQPIMDSIDLSANLTTIQINNAARLLSESLLVRLLGQERRNFKMICFC